MFKETQKAKKFRCWKFRAGENAAVQCYFNAFTPFKPTQSR